MGAPPRFVDLRTGQQMEQQGYGPYSPGEKDVDPLELPDALDIRLIQYSDMAGRVRLHGYWAVVATGAACNFCGPFAYRISDYCQWYHWQSIAHSLSCFKSVLLRLLLQLFYCS